MQSQHAFSEKVALITDGVNPIGRAIAMQLALYGAYVIVGNKDSNENETRALEELRSLGTLANAVISDISTVAGATELVAKVESLFGRLDLLVNTLEFRIDSVFSTTDEDIFDKSIDFNLKSAFFVTKEAMRLMKSRPKPKIVNVFSSCDSEVSDENLIFATVNSALDGFTKSLADYLPENFRVNAVSVSEAEKRQSKFDKLDDELFSPRKGVDPDDVARAVLFLLSSESIGINGQILTVK